MKKIVLALLFVFITSFAFAQDVIITKEGNKIESKVLEINEFDIKYKSFENLDGPVYTMKKTEIATIMYEGGQVDVFNLDMNTAPVQQVTPNNTIYYTQADYEKAKRLRDAGIGCFVGGMAAGTIGCILIVAGAWSLNGFPILAGGVLLYASIPVTIAGIVMWPVGQSRMNTIRRFNPNGFSLFENEKVQLNLAGNGLRLNF
ncbi:MAG: hypothetical protein FWD09_08035 [Lentimicrobiaceae bacterium]|nr:hypothetical protein [Lentimicrobiaceae bacterium]